MVEHIGMMNHISAKVRDLDYLEIVWWLKMLRIPLIFLSAILFRLNPGGKTVIYTMNWCLSRRPL